MLFLTFVVKCVIMLCLIIAVFYLIGLKFVKYTSEEE